MNSQQPSCYVGEGAPMEQRGPQPPPAGIPLGHQAPADGHPSMTPFEALNIPAAPGTQTPVAPYGQQFTAPSTPVGAREPLLPPYPVGLYGHNFMAQNEAVHPPTGGIFNDAAFAAADAIRLMPEWYQDPFAMPIDRHDGPGSGAASPNRKRPRSNLEKQAERERANKRARENRKRRQVRNGRACRQNVFIDRTGGNEVRSGAAPPRQPLQGAAPAAPMADAAQPHLQPQPAPGVDQPLFELALRPVGAGPQAAPVPQPQVVDGRQFVDELVDYIDLRWPAGGPA